MALDGVLLNCILTELKDTIIGGRIDKVYQPEKDEVHLGIRCKNQDRRLLISASPNYPRIHLTGRQKINPITPPVFCMVLRKHLLGGRIIEIEQPDFERILILSIEARDELGDLSVKRLIVEIMGRHSNIILVDDGELIIDSVKRINKDISRVRRVLPGETYNFPPSQNKHNPLTQDINTLENILNMAFEPKRIAGIILNNFTGISKVTAQEIVYRAMPEDPDDLNPAGGSCAWEKLCVSFITFFEGVKKMDYDPSLLMDETGRPLDIFPFPFYQFPTRLQKRFSSVSVALDSFFETRDSVERAHQRTSHILRVLNTNLNRVQKKHRVLLDEYGEAKNADIYRLFGELITANLYQIPKGAVDVELVNYYDPEGKSVMVPLDKGKTPNQNAQSYYKKYNKAKNALIMINRQLKDARAEIQYLENQLDNLDKCTEDPEIQEIHDELVEEGYIRLRNRKKPQKGSIKSKPYHFVSSDGFDIFVGKNNTQNDRLTLRTAGPNDLWLHVKEIPGSHVVVKSQGQNIPDKTLLEAGVLAAYFSRARDSSNVPVDYCPRKNVRKPSGAKAGMVIYDNYKTMFVTPERGIMDRLKGV
ncbi:MAG TPA: NFACT RNA binding domain-containing protein [Clostridia bacterium]|nr:NFACT RNA binding domain-containing protein [Clostridia bacterium]